MRKNRVNKICLECNKKFSVRKSRENSKFCSNDCFGKSQNREIKKTCLWCKKDYMVSRYRAEKSKYCSRICRNHQVEQCCIWCGKPYKIHPSENGKSKYCSPKCYYQSMKGITFYPKMESPNKTEIKLNDIMRELNLPYKFVGNGEVWIGGLNPDFINVNGQKKIIELFGEYWHREGASGNTRKENVRKAIFKKYGYDTLIVWSKELINVESVKQKILNFEQTQHGQ